MASDGGSTLEDVNRGFVILTVGWIECGITALFIVGRVYNRFQKRGGLGVDDWLILISFILAVAFMGVTTPEVQYGTGRHLEFLSEEQKLQSVKLDWVSQAFHIMSTSVAKISIVLFIRQIIGKGHSRMWFLYIMVGMLFVISVVCVAFIFAQCTPAAALWDPSLGDKGKCWDPKVQQGYGYFTASFSVLSDFTLAIFPVSVLWNLQMEWRLKMSLMFFMGLGAFAGIASIIKTMKLETLSSRGDYTFETVDLIIWMMTEQFCIIIAACIPPMRSLFVTIYRKVFNIQSTHDASTNQTSGTKSRQGYVNQPSQNEEHGLSRLESGYWRNETEISAAAAYRSETDGDNTSGHTERRSDSDELLRDQQRGIIKRTEVMISEHRM
ncbi:integral membrane protein [Metarhizium rileyi]|uniref:Integral membrane protein n=1 Tax=Metarhizium rileyi (strain RCEF 4871) TaxID=1649241 RepID=A0A167E4A7_METRR|nr:integral membrane protein [Metarhizium rileyi RCEF 4871]TWU76927.1 hypothetical protein ED733_006960 [Metarhizium rileyi]